MSDKCICDIGVKIADQLRPLSSGRLPQVILHLEDDLTAVFVEIYGVDWILSVLKMEQQRPRERVQ